MGQPIDIVRSSLPAAEHLVLEGVDEIESGVMVRVRAKETPRCPACSSSQVSYHSCYDRTIRDLPWQGKPVRIRLRARRFRCQNASCGRKIFAERLPEVAAPRARETVRLCEVIGLVGYALGGLPGSRILSRLGMPRSDDTGISKRMGASGETLSECRGRLLCLAT